MRALRGVGPRGALGYFLGGHVPPGTPNWHPVLKKISPKIDQICPGSILLANIC